VKKKYSSILIICLVGCSSPAPKNEVSSKLHSCHDTAKPWEIFPGHFYDKEIHLVPIAPEYNPKAQVKSEPGSLGYSVVFVKEGSYYDKIGIQGGDIITSIDGNDLNFKNKTSLTAEEEKVFQKIKQGGKFTISRCLKFE
jgi:hypothetical protein